MPNTDKPILPLPEEFKSPQEAGEFWDSHSVTDYEQSLSPDEMDVDIQRRHCQIEVDQECFLALREFAKKEHKPVNQLVYIVHLQDALRVKRRDRIGAYLGPVLRSVGSWILAFTEVAGPLRYVRRRMVS